MGRFHASDRLAAALLMVAVGGHGITAQVVILRELMAVSAGSEISAGIGLGVWIAAEAMGALLFGRIPTAKAERWLHMVAPISVLAAPTGVLIALLGPSLLGFLPGEGVDIPRVTALALLSCSLPALTHGGLFVLGISGSAAAEGKGNSLGTGYVWEGVGTGVAASLTWLLLLPRVPSVALTALSGIPLALVAGSRFGRNRRQVARVLVALGLSAVLAAVAWSSAPLVRWAWSSNWRGQRVTGVVNTSYGKVVRLERSSQKLLVYDGSPILSQPVNDLGLLEQFGYVPLLVHPEPRQALVVGHGFGILPLLVNSPLESILLVQNDLALHREIMRAAGQQLTAALAHPKVETHSEDPRRHLYSVDRRYDCILIAGRAPASLAANRMFTREFFELCRNRLNDGGILAVPGPGSPGRISPESRSILLSRKASLDAVFSHTQLVLLDFPLLLASDSPFDVHAESLTTRLGEWPHAPVTLRSEYLSALLETSRRKLVGIQADRPQADVEANTDLRPREVFLGMLRENRLHSPWFSAFYETAERAGAIHFVGIILALLAVAVVGAKLRGHRFADSFSIFSSGFSGGAASTITLFVYQVRFGTLYGEMGLLLAVFMVGTALGGWVGSKAASRGTHQTPVFLLAELLLLLACGVLILAAECDLRLPLLTIQLTVGVAIGAQFPVAGSRLRPTRLGMRAGRIAALDFTGGFFGAVVSAAFVVPIWGVQTAVLVVVCLKSVSLLGQGLAAGRLRGSCTISV